LKKPRLEIDLHGTGGNIYLVYGEARKIVPSGRLNAFIEAMLDATKSDAGKKYEDLLAIIDQYVELVDTSGDYPQYAAKSDG
jgi:hypothetical protein